MTDPPVPLPRQDLPMPALAELPPRDFAARLRRGAPAIGTRRARRLRAGRTLAILAACAVP
ncbi:hypothetical protein H7F53_17490, partial [Novosphingobium piscinae]